MDTTTETTGGAWALRQIDRRAARRVGGLLLSLTLATNAAAAAALDGTYTDAPTIDSVVRSIPMVDKSMGYKSLADRLPNLGLKVQGMNVGKFTSDDIRADPKNLRRGDVDYRFWTNAPNAVVHEICPIASTFSFIKRGQQWLPQDRTSNFLINGFGTCAPPR